MTNKPVVFHVDANEEYDAAFSWYLERNQPIAARFADEMQRAIETIRAAPHRWPRDDQGIRRFLLPSFPFAVVYRELVTSIQVIAVAHGRRKPYYWQKRI